MAVLALAGGWVGTGVLTGPAAYAAPSVVSNWRSGPLVVNGSLWRNVPYFVADHTTFFGIWYLQQLLKTYGYTAKWDGRSLLLPELPTVAPNATVAVDGQNLSTAGTLAFGGTTYVPAAPVLTALGGSATYAPATQTLTLNGGATAATQNAAIAGNQATSVTGGGVASPTSTAVHTAEQSLKPQTAAVWQGAHLWGTVPTVLYRSTTSFGVWYLQSVLRAHGITADWNGQRLDIENLPKEVDGSVRIAGQTVATTLFSWRGQIYLPVSALQTAGVQAEVNAANHSVSLTRAGGELVVRGTLTDAAGDPTVGRVVIADSLGQLHVLTTANDGSFDDALHTSSATVVAVQTSETGWVGEDISAAQGASKPLAVTTQQQMTQVDGVLSFGGSKPYSVTQISLRNTITHAHYYADVQANGTFSTTVPTGPYEVFAALTNEDAVYLLQPFLAGGSSVHVNVSMPSLPTGSSLTTAHAVITAKDSGVTADELRSVGTIFEHVYPQVVQQMGAQPVGAVQINLYGSTKTYQQHYLDEGYSQTESQQIAEQSVASEEGSRTINVLMPTFDTVDGLNILAHELTHAVMTELSTQISSWANEGTAWTEGVDAEADGSPSNMLKQGIQWDEWVDIVAEQQQGALIPLGQGDTLNASYNVEAQDYFAVQQLIAKYGWDKFLQYVRKIDSDPNAFADTFGESFSTFSSEVSKVLAKDASRPNQAMAVRVRTLPNGPQQVYFINPSGQRFLVSGLVPNQTYDFVCNADGTVTAPDGLTVTSVAPVSVAVSGDWFLGSGGDGGSQDRQEFDLVNYFGLPFVDQVILYDADGNIAHVYPAIAIPNGLELVRVQAQG
ncbi:MAG: hypothetical protein K6T78_12775 [Alicyclobacillus sp.]|nr:hypothetical protein [Alicyclobacillus sp.]